MNYTLNENLKKIRRGLTDFFKDRLIWCLTALLCLTLFFTGFIFYLFAWQNNAILEKKDSSLKIKSELYEQITSRLKQQAKTFQENYQPDYPDIFR